MMFHKKGGGSAYCRRCRKSANVVDNVSKNEQNNNISSLTNEFIEQKNQINYAITKTFRFFAFKKK